MHEHELALTTKSASVSSLEGQAVVVVVRAMLLAGALKVEPAMTSQNGAHDFFSFFGH